jgi:hypothetical protein
VGVDLRREAIVSNDTGLPVFELLRSWRHDAVLCTFGLLELNDREVTLVPPP